MCDLCTYILEAVENYRENYYNEWLMKLLNFSCPIVLVLVHARCLVLEFVVWVFARGGSGKRLLLASVYFNQIPVYPAVWERSHWNTETLK